MRYFLDTEFNEFGGELISMALVCENGSEMYVAQHCRNPGPWVAVNVMPIIHCAGAEPIWIDPDDFSSAIGGFLHDDNAPVIVADWPDDISYFCKALITAPGQMIALKRAAFHLLRVDAYPTDLPGAVQHNALWDARALRHVFMSTCPVCRRVIRDGDCADDRCPYGEKLATTAHASEDRA